MTYPLVGELAGDRIDVAVACRVLEVPRSSYYDWLGRTVSARDLDDAYLIQEIRTTTRPPGRPTAPRACTTTCASGAAAGSAESAWSG